MMHIADPLTAFYFDRAVTTFGTEVESAMDEAAEGAKTNKESQRRRQMTLAKYMKDPDGKAAPGTFRDPAAR
jgi:ssDNA-binding replication factor A large subunit